MMLARVVLLLQKLEEEKEKKIKVQPGCTIEMWQ